MNREWPYGAKLIGVTGYAEHGKDAVGKVLVEEYGFNRYAFADQLKSMALVLNPFIDREMKTRLWTVVQDQGWSQAKKDYPEVRRFLQVLGTEAVRDHLGTDAWVKALALRMAEDGFMEIDHTGLPYALGYGAQIVITDVRFPNEAGWILGHGGEIWRVNRRNADGTAYDNGMGSDHPSEAYVAELPATVEIWAETLGDLQDEVRYEMAQFAEKF